MNFLFKIFGYKHQIFIFRLNLIETSWRFLLVKTYDYEY